jgi:hypothetical protein
VYFRKILSASERESANAKHWCRCKKAKKKGKAKVYTLDFSSGGPHGERKSAENEKTLLLRHRGKKRQKSVPTSSSFSRVDIVFIIIVVDFLFFSRLLPALLPRV